MQWCRISITSMDSIIMREEVEAMQQAVGELACPQADGLPRSSRFLGSTHFVRAHPSDVPARIRQLLPSSVWCGLGREQRRRR